MIRFTSDPTVIDPSITSLGLYRCFPFSLLWCTNRCIELELGILVQIGYRIAGFSTKVGIVINSRDITILYKEIIIGKFKVESDKSHAINMVKHVGTYSHSYIELVDECRSLRRVYGRREVCISLATDAIESIPWLKLKVTNDDEKPSLYLHFQTIVLGH